MIASIELFDFIRNVYQAIVEWFYNSVENQEYNLLLNK